MDSQQNGLFRPHWSWVVAVLACCPCMSIAFRGPWVLADEPSANTQSKTGADAEEVEALIERLSSTAFAARETASTRLLEIGEPALELLHKLELHPSLEVRERAKRICEEIERRVFDSVTKKFILDPDTTQSYGLPAWDGFRAIAGDSRTSKLLFVMMLREHHELAICVDAAGHAKNTPNEPIVLQQLQARAIREAERLRANGMRGQFPEAGDTVALLMACTLLKDAAPIEVNETIVSSLYRREVGDYFVKPGYSRSMRALAGQWIPKTQAVLADEAMMIALQRNVPEGVVVARRHLDAASDQETRTRAFQCLARFGNESDIANAAVHLNDESILSVFEEQSEVGLSADGIDVSNRPPPGGRQPQPTKGSERSMIVRVSDLALAVCMVLGSEDVVSVFPKYKPNDLNGILLMDVAFASDEQDLHKQAIANWLRKHAQSNEKAN